MSKETSTWLNQNTLIGYTDNRGSAWHYRASDQGDEPNHYAGPIPISDVERRLFHWEALEAPEQWTAPNGELITSLTDKVIFRSDTYEKLGTFRIGYQPHQYREWLLSNVSRMLDDRLNISSSGLLRGGAVAWVEISIPDTFTTPEGVSFRPNVLASTSFDGTLATTYKPTITATVCDNTLGAALKESGPVLKVKHSAKSMGKIQDAREALGIVYTTADDFMDEVQSLCNTKMTDNQFEQLVDQIAPMPHPKDVKTTRGLTLAENKREELWSLWTTDDRVTPWNGSAFGAYQALNTYRHHVANIRGMERAERNMLNAVSGKTEAEDAEELKKILSITA